MAHPRTLAAPAWPVLLVLGLVLGSGGCELIISDKIPAFTCRPGSEGVCAADSFCDLVKHQCMPRAQACNSAMCAGGSCNLETGFCTLPDGAPASHEGGVDATPSDVRIDQGTGPSDAHVLRETASDAPDKADVAEASSTCRTPGCHCSGHADCASGVCAGEQPLGTELYAKAGEAAFCAAPCCTSADCDAASVCYAPAAGGNYCVPPALLGRSPDGGALGANLPGQACAVDSNCRSGLCAGGLCADTCCAVDAASQCTNGTVCRFGNFPGRSFDNKFVAYCARPAGPAPTGTACGANDMCQSGWCDTVFVLSGICRDACRKTDQTCPSCVYVVNKSPVPSGQPQPVGAVCAMPVGGPPGSACMAGTSCRSGICDQKTMQCADICFITADCQAGWSCGPKSIPVPGGGTNSVLGCGT